MIIDAFTISGAVVTLAIIILLTVVMIRGAGGIEQPEGTPSGGGEGDAKPTVGQLCLAVRSIYPESYPGIDYVIADEGNGAYIKDWFLNRPKPTDDDLARALRARQRHG